MPLAMRWSAWRGPAQRCYPAAVARRVEELARLRVTATATHRVERGRMYLRTPGEIICFDIRDPDVGGRSK